MTTSSLHLLVVDCWGAHSVPRLSFMSCLVPHYLLMWYVWVHYNYVVKVNKQVEGKVGKKAVKLKSSETRKLPIATCRYTSGHLITNSVRYM